MLYFLIEIKLQQYAQHQKKNLKDHQNTNDRKKNTSSNRLAKPNYVKRTKHWPNESTLIS